MNILGKPWLASGVLRALGWVNWYGWIFFWYLSVFAWSLFIVVRHLLSLLLYIFFFWWFVLFSTSSLQSAWMYSLVIFKKKIVLFTSCSWRRYRGWIFFSRRLSNKLRPCFLQTQTRLQILNNLYIFRKIFTIKPKIFTRLIFKRWWNSSLKWNFTILGCMSAQLLHTNLFWTASNIFQSIKTHPFMDLLLAKVQSNSLKPSKIDFKVTRFSY